MNGKIMIIGIAVMFLVVGLSGCEEVDSRFVGLWTPQNVEYPAFTFFSNKTYLVFAPPISKPKILTIILQFLFDKASFFNLFDKNAKFLL